MTRRAFARVALLGLLALPTAGCDALCDEGAISWCPPGRSDLNQPPSVGEIRIDSWEPDAVPPIGERVVGDLALVDHLTQFSTSVFDSERDDLLFEWDLDGDGDFEKRETHTDPEDVSPEAFRTYRARGTFPLRFRASDFPTEFGLAGETTRERQVAIIGEDDNRGPVAAFSFSPRQARVGEPVFFDAGGSSDPDFFDNPPFNLLSYSWSFGDRGGDFGQTTRHTYTAPGEYEVQLQVHDQYTRVAPATAVQKVTVLEAGAANSPPTARFTAVPAAPLIGQQVRLDGSLSSDPEGPIARFRWDLDGDGSFETDGGRAPARGTSYTTPGEHLINLRVTDSQGATGTARRVINVRRPPAPPVGAAAAQAARAPRTELAFSARLKGRPVSRRPGRIVRRGPRLSLTGRSGRGRLLARALDPPGRATKAQRALRRFLRAPWRTRLTFRLDQRSRRWSARGVVLARTRSAPRAQACLRVRIGGRPGRRSSGRLSLLGGTKAAARLRGSARFRFRLEPSGSASVLGRLRARRGARRGLPPACARLR